MCEGAGRSGEIKVWFWTPSLRYLLGTQVKMLNKQLGIQIWSPEEQYGLEK